MFFESSMRSVRNTSLPVADLGVESRHRPRLRPSLPRSPPSASGSGPNVLTNASTGRSRRGPRARTPGSWRPSVRCGSRPVPRPSTSAARRATSSGRMRISFGPQNGRVGEVGEPEVGPGRAHHPGHEPEVQVLHEHHVTVGCRRGRSRRRTPGSPSGTRPTTPRKCWSKRGRRGRSKSPWKRNQSVAFETTS